MISRAVERLDEYWLVFVCLCKQLKTPGLEHSSIHSYYCISEENSLRCSFPMLLATNYVPPASVEKSIRFFWRDRDGFKFGFRLTSFASLGSITIRFVCMYINNSSRTNPICTLLFGSEVFWDAQQILTLSNWKACSWVTRQKGEHGRLPIESDKKFVVQMRRRHRISMKRIELPSKGRWRERTLTLVCHRNLSSTFYQSKCDDDDDENEKENTNKKRREIETPTKTRTKLCSNSRHRQDVIKICFRLI